MTDNTKPTGRIVIAIAEVCAAFAAMHVLFRAFKRFTAWGQWEYETGMNFSPGLAMIAVALAMITLRYRWSQDVNRRPSSFSTQLVSYGLTPRPFFPSLNAALACLLILGLFGALLASGGVQLTKARSQWPVALLVAAWSIPATCAVLWVLRRAGSGVGGMIDRVPRALGLVLLIGVPAAPILAALWQQRFFGHELLTVLWLLLGAAIGEEVFFRGYVQSRLNEAFGRPWRLLGVAFGPGLIIASAFFGLVHVLNSADYFTGVYCFAWQAGLTTFATFFYGFLRERTGSILAPAVVHFFTDLSVRLPALMTGGIT